MGNVLTSTARSNQGVAFPFSVGAVATTTTATIPVAVAPTPTVAQVQSESNTVASTMPIIRKVASTVVTNGTDYVLPSGKHKGKTLGEVQVLDPDYITFYRSTQKDATVLAYIDKVITAKTPMPAPVSEVAKAPAPAPAPTTPSIVSSETDKAALVANCRELINAIPEFTGRGIGTNLIPFIRTNFGNRFDYTSWEEGDLKKLKLLLIKKSGGVTPPELQ